MKTLARVGLVLAVVPFALAATSCGEQPPVCSGAGANNCLLMGGTYAVTTSSASGECEFAPYLVGSEVVLEQNGSEVSTTLMDPAGQTQQRVSGEAYNKLATDAAELIGSFSMDGRFTRLALPNAGTVVTLRVTVSGSVSRGTTAADTWRLTGTVRSQDMESGCSVQVSFSADRLGGNPDSGGGGTDGGAG